MRKLVRRLASFSLLLVALIAAQLALGCVALRVARAGAIDPLLRSQVLKLLDKLGITSGGVYTPPSSGGWTDNGTTVTTTTATDGVGIGGGAVGASEIFDVTGDPTRKDVNMEAGTATTPGNVTITAGTRAGVADGVGGSITLKGGTGESGGGNGGYARLMGGATGGGGAGWAVLGNGSTDRWAVEANGHFVPQSDDAYDIGSATAGARTIYYGAAGAFLDAGTATPEGAITAPVGSLFVDTSATPGTIFYGKLSGAGNTGWVTFAPTTAWVAYTPTLTWTTNTTIALAQWRRVGDSLDLRLIISVTGAPDTASLTITLPSGLSVDTAKNGGGTLNFTAAAGGAVHDSSAGVYFCPVGISLNTSTDIMSVYTQNASRQWAAVTQAVPMTWASGDFLHLHVEGIPIDGW